MDSKQLLLGIIQKCSVHHLYISIPFMYTDDEWANIIYEMSSWPGITLILGSLNLGPSSIEALAQLLMINPVGTTNYIYLENYRFSDKIINRLNGIAMKNKKH